MERGAERGSGGGGKNAEASGQGVKVETRRASKRFMLGSLDYYLPDSADDRGMKGVNHAKKSGSGMLIRQAGISPCGGI